jgi:glycosyltransferase involved in cell wall biosynthesis
MFVDKQIYKRSDVVLIGSNLHKNTFETFSQKKPLIILPAGTEILKNPPKVRDRVIVSLTKWDRGKNPEFILQVAKKLVGDFVWLIAGNWSDQDQKEVFLKKIKEMKLEKKVKIIGKVTEEEKRKLFSQARVLVHPIVEAFGMFALEAAGCGCPFVIPKNSGVTELFKEEKHGYFPGEGNTASFVERIEDLLKDEKKTGEMGRKAWEQAKKYSWKEHALKLKKIFEKAILK